MRKQVFATLVLFQLLFTFSFSNMFGANTPQATSQCLFILFDAGETHALIPLIEKLSLEGKTCKILAMGTAQELIKQKKYETIDLSNYVGTPINNSWSREKEIDPVKVTELVGHFLYSNVDCVISGVSSQIQGQFLEAFSARSIKTIAYWDNFNAEGQDAYFQVAQKVQKKASRVFVPSQYVKDSAVFKDRSPQSICIVGHPALEKWVKEVTQTNKDPLFQKLGFKDAPKKTITIVGGYGEQYEKAFRLMMQCVEHASIQLPLQFIIHPHPKTADAKFERSEIARSRLRNIVVIKPEHNISTIQAVSLADVVLCYNSTVGFQALGCKKNVLFVVPKEDRYTNLAIDLHIAKKVSSVEEFMHEIVQPYDEEGADLFTVLGIPQDSLKAMMTEMKKK